MKQKLKNNNPMHNIIYSVITPISQYWPDAALEL